MTVTSTRRLSVAAVSLLLAACSEEEGGSAVDSAAQQTSTTVVVTTPTTVGAAPSTTAPAPTTSAAPANKVSANNATIAELQRAFEAAGISNASRWAREVDEYRPYPSDSSFPKLR